MSEYGWEVRQWACELVDTGQCSPACLMASDPTYGAPCDCVCEGLHHGSLRHPHPATLMRANG